MRPVCQHPCKASDPSKTTQLHRDCLWFLPHDSTLALIRYSLCTPEYVPQACDANNVCNGPFTKAHVWARTFCSKAAGLRNQKFIWYPCGTWKAFVLSPSFPFAYGPRIDLRRAGPTFRLHFNLHFPARIALMKSGIFQATQILRQLSFSTFSLLFSEAEKRSIPQLFAHLSTAATSAMRALVRFFLVPPC